MSTAVLQLHHRDSFERNVTRALLAGAAAGVTHLVATRLGLPAPFSWMAIAATALAAVRGDRTDRILLIASALIATGAPWLFGLSPGWTIALSAMGAGVVMVRAHLCERGEEGQLASTRPGTLNYLLGGALTAALALVAIEVTRVLGDRLFELDTPAVLAAAALGAVMALFVAIGSLPAHLALRPDPVESRCEELIEQLDGDFRTLATRALTLYRQCGEAMAKLPRNREREELARTLSQMTRGAVELASDWSGVEQELEERTHRELTDEIAELDDGAQKAQDEVARRQLRLAAESLREELERVQELKLRRERILAKLKAEVALLERARVSLIGIRSGQTQLRAAELSAMARKFTALSRLQSEEAKLADQVALGAELDA